MSDDELQPPATTVIGHTRSRGDEEEDKEEELHKHKKHKQDPEAEIRRLKAALEIERVFDKLLFALQSYKLLGVNYDSTEYEAWERVSVCRWSSASVVCRWSSASVEVYEQWWDSDGGMGFFDRISAAYNVTKLQVIVGLLRMTVETFLPCDADYVEAAKWMKRKKKCAPPASWKAEGAELKRYVSMAIESQGNQLFDVLPSTSSWLD